MSGSSSPEAGGAKISTDTKGGPGKGIPGAGGPLDHNQDQRDDGARARQMEQQAQVDYKQHAGDATSQQGQGAGRSDKA